MNRIRPMATFLAVLLLTGCMGGAVAPATFKYYTLEYPSPGREGMTSRGDIIRWERFTAAHDFIGRDMVYRSQPFVLNKYRYHLWTAPPADIVQELLLRDLRQSALFRAVLASDDMGEARYVLNGRLEEFLQRDEREVSLAVSITITDTKEGESGGGVLLQKAYRLSEPMASRGPQEVARSMSAAMARLSATLLKDIDALLREKEKKTK